MPLATNGVVVRLFTFTSTKFRRRSDNVGLSTLTVTFTLTCTTTLTYLYFAGEPNNYRNQDCVTLNQRYSGSLWGDKDCETDPQPLFICKYTLSGKSLGNLCRLHLQQLG